jgi:hypothetical protein
MNPSIVDLVKHFGGHRHFYDTKYKVIAKQVQYFFQG